MTTYLNDLCLLKRIHRDWRIWSSIFPKFKEKIKLSTENHISIKIIPPNWQWSKTHPHKLEFICCWTTCNTSNTTTSSLDQRKRYLMEIKNFKRIKTRQGKCACKYKKQLFLLKYIWLHEQKVVNSIEYVKYMTTRHKAKGIKWKCNVVRIYLHGVALS